MNLSSGVDILVGELRVGFEQMHRDMMQAQALVEQATQGMARSMQTLSETSMPLQTMSNTLSGLGRDLVVAGTVLSGFSAGLAFVGKESLQIAGFMEQSRVAMMTFTKSAAEADKLLSHLMDFAVKTPFEIKGLVNASRQLIGFGFEVEKVPRMLKILGDSIAATGEASEDRMRRIILAFGAIQNRGTLAIKELNQLGMLGIPGMKMLADEIDKTTKQITDATKKRAIDGATAIEALLQAFEKKFTGAMEAQSQTLLGRLSNLHDAVTKTFFEIGKVIAPIGKLFIEMGFDVLNGVNAAAQAFGKLSEGTQIVIVAMVGVAAAIGPVMVVLGGLFLALGSLASPFGVLAAAISVFAVAFAGLAAIIIMSWPGIKAVFDVMKTDLAAFADELSVAFDTGGIAGWLSVWGSFGEEMGKIFNNIVDLAKQWGKALLSAFDAITGLPSLFEAVWKVITTGTGEAFKFILDIAGIFGKGLVHELGVVGQIIKAVFNEIMSFVGKALEKVGGLKTLIADSFLAAVPALGPFLTAMKGVAIGYGDVFDKAMKAAIGNREFGQITDELFRKLRDGGDRVLKNFGDAFSHVGENAKKAGKSIVEAGNDFLRWAAATENSISAQLRFTTVHKEEVDKRIRDLRRFTESAQGFGTQYVRDIERQIRDISSAMATLGTPVDFLKTRLDELRTALNRAFDTQMQGVMDSFTVAVDELNQKLPVTVNNFGKLSSETDRLINGGWKVLGADLQDFKKNVAELGKDLGIALDLEDPFQKIERIWGNLNKVMESGQVTAMKSREIWMATFESVAGQINKAADQLLLFEDGFTTFFGTKMQAAAMNIELAFLKISTTLRDSNRSVFDDFIEKGATMEQVLGKLWGNLKNAFNDIWKSALKEVANVFADIMSEMERLVLNVFKDLMMSTLRGILGQFFDIDKAIQGITKRVTSELVPALVGQQTSNIAFPQVGGAATGAVDGAKGAAGAASGGGGLLGSLNLITGALTAVFGALSFFQGRRMEQDIGRIEVTTREIKAIFASLESSIRLTGMSTEFSAARLGEITAALSVIGDGIYALVEPVKSIEDLIRSHVLPHFDTLESLLSGGNINITPREPGRPAGNDVWIINWQPALDVLNSILRVEMDWLPRISDGVSQGFSAVSIGQRDGFALVVSAIQVGTKSIINAVLAGGGINAQTNIGPVNIGADTDMLGQVLVNRVSGYRS